MKRILGMLCLLFLTACSGTATPAPAPVEQWHFEAPNGNAGSLCQQVIDEGYTGPIGTLFSAGDTPKTLNWNAELGMLSSSDNVVQINVPEGQTVTPTWPEGYKELAGAQCMRCEGGLYYKLPPFH